MWMKSNPNPGHKEAPDCVIRALAIALNKRWIDVYDDLCKLGRKEYNMPSADAVLGKYLYQMGFEPFLLPESYPVSENAVRNERDVKPGRISEGTVPRYTQ